MARGLQISSLQVRLACSATLLAVGMTALLAGARLGVVHLDAGDMTLVAGGGEEGLMLNVDSRGCPPDCNIGVDWRPVATFTSTGL